MDTLYRHWLILKMIPRRRRISTTEICSRLLRENVIKVSLRAIQRDLVSLQRNFPLVSDDKKPAGWKWHENAPAFDIPNMDSMTALTFKLAESHTGKLFPHGFYAALKPYFAAADERLRQTSSASLSAWPDKVRVVSRNLPHIPPYVPEEISDVVYTSLLEARRFASRYRNTVGDVKDFEVTPLGMVLVEGLTYLVATLFDYEDPVLLLLHRIMEATMLDKSAIVPEGFNLDDYIARELSFPVGRDLKLKVLFSSKSDAHRLQESPISEDQRIREMRNGFFELTATASDSVQLRWWLRGYGERVEVLSPKSLRDEFALLAQKVSEIYECSS